MVLVVSFGGQGGGVGLAVACRRMRQGEGRRTNRRKYSLAAGHHVV